MTDGRLLRDRFHKNGKIMAKKKCIMNQKGSIFFCCFLAKSRNLFI